MIAAARARADDPRLRFGTGVAEDLAYPDGAFDLVTVTTSFDHWRDQRAGLAECARVPAPRGRLVLSDLFSLWLTPTLLAGHRGHARTKRRASALLGAGGFRTVAWRSTYAIIRSTRRGNDRQLTSRATPGQRDRPR
jgi:ubiquinone/menaquinone biosynthesis C-methylase UbiE